MYNARIIHLYIYTRSVDFRVPKTKREDYNRSASVREQTSGKKNMRQRRTTATTTITEARDGVYFTNGRAWDAIGLTELYLRICYYRHHYYSVHTCPSYCNDKFCITRVINIIMK